MPYTVYTIHTFPASNNSFQTCRDESWQPSKIGVYDTEEEAKQVIRDKSRVFTELPTYLVDLPSEESKRQFVEAFCFTDDMYLTKRRFFIGKPPKHAITAALQKQGVTVL
jgi:hypothetical protein